MVSILSASSHFQAVLASRPLVPSSTAQSSNQTPLTPAEASESANATNSRLSRFSDSGKASAMLQMQGYFSGLDSTTRQETLARAHASDNPDLQAAALSYENNEARRPLVTTIEFSNINDQALSLQQQGYEIIHKPQSIQKVAAINVQRPLLNPLIQQMAQADLDQALDLSGLQSSRLAQSLAADFTSMKERIDSTFSPQQASVLNYTLGMGVGVGESTVHDFDSAVRFNYYLNTARETVDTLVKAPALAAEMHQLLDRSEALQAQRQNDIIKVGNDLLETNRLSGQTASLVSQRSAQAMDVLNFNHEYAERFDTPLPSFAELSDIAKGYPIPGTSSSSIAKTLSHFQQEQARHEMFINGEIKIQNPTLLVDTKEVAEVMKVVLQLQRELEV